jgi:hypothetical protein
MMDALDIAIVTASTVLFLTVSVLVSLNPR